MFLAPFIPYFTFGEDYKMVKELCFAFTMLAPAAFAVVEASLSVSEEIEGRTAVTLMSKPISRRQFLLGKFGGILLAALVLYGILGTYFEGVMLFKHWWDKMDPRPEPVWVTASLRTLDLPDEPRDLLRGAGLRS